MQYIGSIQRLQIVPSSPKVGPRGTRQYDPASIVTVPWMYIDSAGCVHDNLVDVHHSAHPASRNAEVNPISIGFTAHYKTMRARFGPHLTDGIAAENILVSTDGLLSPDSVYAGLLIVSRDAGAIRLQPVTVAEPCVEFTRFAMAVELPARDPYFKESFQFLRAGMRGFYTTYAGPAARVALGDAVFTP